MDSKIKDIIDKIDNHIKIYDKTIYSDSGKLIYSKNYYDSIYCNDDDIEFQDKGNKLLELCIERCIAEHFFLDNWVLFEVPFFDEKGMMFYFVNKTTKESLDFFAYYSGYAVPLLMIDGIRYDSNTVRKAIYKYNV